MKLGYLCVTGSYGWGYADADSSDIDVRGIYYKSDGDRFLANEGDQRDRVFGKLDFTLWSFDKFWSLLKKSNPTCIEWLLSPELFTDNLFFDFKTLAKHGYFNRKTLAIHYISMAKQNFYKYGKSLSPKKVRYIMRGIMSARAVLELEQPVMNLLEVDISEGQNYQKMIEETEELIKEKEKDEVFMATYGNNKFIEKYYNVWKNSWRDDL